MLIHNAAVTGSLTLNGIDIGDITGSESSIASLNQATASLSSSIAILSGSFLTTSASYSSASGSLSTRVTTIEGKYATTGSNFFNGSQTVTGSLTVTNQIVAQTLNIQQVTSSTVYSSGSNVFGNSLSNTQQLTGSVSITGSLSVNGTSAVVGTGTTNYIPKFTNGSALGDSLVYDDGTNVGIGTSSPDEALTISRSTFTNIKLVETTASNTILLGHHSSTNEARLTVVGAYPLIFKTSDAERARFTAGGNILINSTTDNGNRLQVTGNGYFSENLGVGTSSPGEKLSVYGGNSSFTGATNNPVSIRLFNNAQTSSGFWIGQGWSSGTDNIGYLLNTANAGLVFATNNAERLRLDPSGNLGLGVTPSASTFKNFQINTTGILGSANGYIWLGNNWVYNSGDKYIANGTSQLFGLNDGGFQWFTAPSGTAGNAISFTQAMTLTSGGNLLVGSAVDNGNRLQVTGNGYFSGSVSIGTASPSAKLHIANTSSGIIFEQSGSAATIVGTNPAGTSSQGLFLRGYPLTFTGDGGGAPEQMRLDPSGNLGLGVVPSAWGGSYKAVQIANSALWAATNDLHLTLNILYDGAYKYIDSGYATRYNQYLGQHIWYNAPSGTAGNAITFTQAMTLDASGRLGIGTASPYANLDLGASGANNIILRNTVNAYNLGYIGNSGGRIDIGFSNSNGSLVTLPYLSVNSLGNVLIGTTVDSGEKLQVDGTGRFSGFLTLNDNQSISHAGSGILNFIRTDNATNPAAKINFQTSQGTTKWQIGTNQSTGVGFEINEGDATANRFYIAPGGAATFSSSVTAGGDILVPYDTTNRFIGARFSATYYNGIVSNGTSRSTGVVSRSGDATDYIWFGTNDATERVRITNGGNLLVGTTTDSGYRLDVNGTGRFTGQVNINNSSALRLTRFSTESTYYGDVAYTSAGLILTSIEGYIKIGKGSGSSPTTYLSIIDGGAATFSSNVTATNLILNAPSGSGSGRQEFYTGGTRFGYIGTAIWATGESGTDFTIASVGSLRLATGDATTKMTITSGGNVGIGTTSPGRTVHILGQTGIGTVLKLEGAAGTTTYLQLSYNGATNAQSGYIGYNSSSQMQFFTNDTLRATLDALGNLGLGVTPSAWNSGYKVMDISAWGSIAGEFGTQGTISLVSNCFANSTGYNNWTYVNTAPATRYKQYNGEHQWFNAPSGTAGNAISFTQAMTLTANGRLLLGTTTEGTDLLQVNGGVRVTTGDIDLDSPNSILRANNTRILGTNRKMQVWDNVSAYVDVLTMATTGAATFSSSVTAGGTIQSTALYIPYKSITTSNTLYNEYYVNTSTLAGYVGNGNGILSGGGDTNFGIRAEGALLFAAGGNNERIRITSAGNVGIGTTSPSYKTEVAGALEAYWNGTAFTSTPLALAISNTIVGGYDPVLIFQQTDSGGTTKNAGGIGLVGTGAWTAGNNANQVSDMYFLVRNNSGGISERMRIKSDGNVGIGTTSPGSILETYAGTPIISINGTTLGGSRGIEFKHSGENLGHVKFNASSGELGISVGKAAFGSFITFTSDTAERMRIASTGNVGIGTTSPGEKLEVNGNILATNFNSANAVVNTADTYTGTAKITNIITLSQAEYDAIGSPSSSYLYVII